MSILRKLRDRRVFELEIITIPTGGTYWPLSNPYQGIELSTPKSVAQIKEMCDEHFNEFLNANELEALGREILEMSRELRSSEQARSAGAMNPI